MIDRTPSPRPEPRVHSSPETRSDFLPLDQHHNGGGSDEVKQESPTNFLFQTKASSFVRLKSSSEKFFTMRGSVKCDFQVEDQGGSATPVPVKDHSVDLPPEHVRVRAQARGDRGGVREEVSHAGRRLLHISAVQQLTPHWLFSSSPS